MGILSILSALARLPELLNAVERLGRELMSVKDELKAAIAAEREQVLAAIAALEAKIGETLTADDVAELKGNIGGIYEPAPPAEEAGPVS